MVAQSTARRRIVIHVQGDLHVGEIGRIAVVECEDVDELRQDADAGPAAGEGLRIALEHDRVPAHMAQQMRRQQPAVRTADDQSAPYGHAVGSRAYARASTSEAPAARHWAGADVRLDLLGVGASDDARHHGPAEQPAERKFKHRAAAAGREIIELLDDAPIAFVDELVGVVLAVGEPRALRRRRAALVLAGEEAAGQGKIRQQPQPPRRHRRDQVALDVAREQAIFILA
jgi:hypothetical protein